MQKNEVNIIIGGIAAVVAIIALGTALFFFQEQTDISPDSVSVASSSASSITAASEISENSSSSASIELASSSSATAVVTGPIVTGPIAPFDGCNSLVSYSNHSWFPVLKDAMYQQSFFVVEVSQACLSADYLIFIRPMKPEWASHLYRFSLKDLKLEEASIEVQYIGHFHVETFGKRDGDIIPLLRDKCVTDIYNVRRNTYDASDYLCRDAIAACTDPSTPRAIGDETYPSLPEYQHLTWLGPLFTASRCGPDRLKQVAGGEGFDYKMGSSITLKALPSSALHSELESIGYACAPEGCMRWELWKTVKVRDLLKLLPYAAEMRGDDCLNCG